MTTRLRAELVGLAEDAPVPPDLAARAWRAGRRRRLRRRTMVTVTSAAIVAVVLLLVPSVSLRHTTHPVAGAPGARIDGYPQRIGFERPSARLPDRPGPLAATLDDNNFGNGRDLGVTSRGRLWELPLGWNVLSPDGSLLLSAPDSGATSRLEVHDLSSGARHEFQNVTGSYDARPSGMPHLDDYAPVYWSQDQAAVLASFAPRSTPVHHHPMVLDLGSGALTPVGGDEPAGFRSPSQPVTVRKVGGENAAGGIVATTTNLRTGRSRDLRLRLADPWRGNPNADLTASVSPDGRTLLLVEPGRGRYPDARLRLFALGDGSELSPRRIGHLDASCLPSWRGADPVLGTEDVGARSKAAGAAVVTSDGPHPLVAVHYRLQSSCLQLTEAALEAGPHRALFGTWTYLWTWYWWELLVAGGLPALALLGLLARRRRAGHRNDVARGQDGMG
jgi:hypothetical protein